MKTAELTGALPDYWVARAEGDRAKIKDSICWRFESDQEHGDGCGFFSFDPSTDWAHGGPIIERERIELTCVILNSGLVWEAWSDRTPYDLIDEPESLCDQSGPTPLIAAMRAYVASKFGDTVPDEVPTVHGQR